MLRCLSLWLALSAVAFAELALPGGENLERPIVAQPTRGRLNSPGALLIKEGRSSWKPNATEAKAVLVEFWLKPVGWDAWKPVRVPVARIKAGGAVYEVVKPADVSELHLIGPEGVLQLYPLYSWDEARWSRTLNRKRPFQKSVGWHHVAWHVGEESMALFVDGFPARSLKKAEAAPGPLEAISLEGAPGTAFDTLRATPLYQPLSSREVRQRYLTALRSEPDLEPDHLTIPYLASAPVVNGEWSEEEWQGATRLTGFGTYKGFRLSNREAEAYMGYDDKALYVAVVLPDRKHSPAQTFDLLLGPPFVSGEEPRRLVQFIGSLSGERKSQQVLPTRQADLSLPWEWKVSRSNGQLIAEASLPFGEPGFPERPAPGELWSWNLANRSGDLAWIAPGKLGLYDTLQEVGTLRFERNGPAVRPGPWKIADGSLEIGLALRNAPDKGAEAQLRLYAEGEVFPIAEQRWPLSANADAAAVTPISLPLTGSEGGWATLELRDASGLLYRHSVRLPSGKKPSASKLKPKP